MAFYATLLRTLGVFFVAIGVAACGAQKSNEKTAEDYDPSEGFSVAELVGATNNPPDEFAVIATAPLEMPKDFAALPTPQPGARSSLTPDPIAEARQVLLGDTSPQAANARVSVSESALLSAAGTATDPNIRSVLAAEQAEVDAGERTYVLDRVFPSLREYRGADLKDTIRPSEERERLSSALDTQRNPSNGIATIPSTPSRVVAQPPVTPTASTAIQPVRDPVTGDELIYIPE